jgi:hypothetical protein
VKSQRHLILLGGKEQENNPGKQAEGEGRFFFSILLTVGRTRKNFIRLGANASVSASVILLLVRVPLLLPLSIFSFFPTSLLPSLVCFVFFSLPVFDYGNDAIGTYSCQ